MNLKVKLSQFREFDNFEYLENPKCFHVLFFGKNLPLIQLFDSTILKDRNGKKEYPIGFAGKFNWENNKIVPLDGDSYDERMLVLAIREWESDGYKGLDILVDGDW